MIGTSYWYMHTDQWRNDGYSADSLASPLADGPPGRHAHGRRDRAVRAAGLDAVLPAVLSATRSTSPTTRRRRSTRARRPSPACVRRERAAGRQPAAGHRGRRRPGELAAHAGPLALQPAWAPRRRATSTSSSTCSAPTPTSWAARTRRRRGRPTSSGSDEAPEGKLDLLLSADFRMTSTTLLSDVVLPGGDLVREARPVLDRHAPVRARLHPGDRPAVGGARATSRLFHLARAAVLRDWRGPTSGSAQDLVSVPLQHDTAGRDGAARRSRRGLARPGGPGVPGARCRSSRSSSATTPRSPTSSRRVGPLADSLGFTVKNVTYRLEEEVGSPRGEERRDARRRRRRPARRSTPTRSWPRRSSRFSGTTNGALAVQGFRTLEQRVGKTLADLAEGSEEKRITFADTQVAPVAGHHVPGVVRVGDRRTPVRAVHGQHRAAQAVPHPDRPDALLPRPRLDARPRRGAADLPAAARHAPAVRRARPRTGRRRSRSRSATSPRTRSGRSTPSTRTTSSCSRSPAAARRCG